MRKSGFRAAVWIVALLVPSGTPAWLMDTVTVVGAPVAVPLAGDTVTHDSVGVAVHAIGAALPPPLLIVNVWSAGSGSPSMMLNVSDVGDLTIAGWL